MAHEYHAQSSFKRRDAGSTHACEHLLGDDPCVGNFCSRPPLAPWPSSRRRRRRTGTALCTRMWHPRSASASSCAMVPRWCIITTTPNGTSDRSRGPATSSATRRARAGTHRGSGRGISIGVITTAGRGSAHPVRTTSTVMPSSSSMVTPSSGCMRPGTQAVRHSATTSRTPGSSTDTPAPIAIASATDHACGVPRPGRERFPARRCFPYRASQNSGTWHATAQGGGSQLGVRERDRSGGHAWRRGRRGVRAQLRRRRYPARLDQLPEARTWRGPARPTAPAG